MNQEKLKKTFKEYSKWYYEQTNMKADQNSLSYLAWLHKQYEIEKLKEEIEKLKNTINVLRITVETLDKNELVRPLYAPAPM